MDVEPPASSRRSARHSSAPGENLSRKRASPDRPAPARAAAPLQARQGLSARSRRSNCRHAKVRESPAHGAGARDALVRHARALSALTMLVGTSRGGTCSMLEWGGEGSDCSRSTGQVQGPPSAQQVIVSVPWAPPMAPPMAPPRIGAWPPRALRPVS